MAIVKRKEVFSMATNKIYNINAMRPALIKARELGNRSVIGAKMVKELGISETYFKHYVNSVEKLFFAVCNYVDKKNSPSATEDDRKSALNAIYPLWKALLECGEESKFKRTLHASEHDISSLVGFVQTFANSQNNVNMEEKFVSTKVWAKVNLNNFRKKVETDLGIRIAEVEVLTVEQSEFLRKERSLLGKKRKMMAKIDEAKANIAFTEKRLTHAKNEETIKLLNEDIERFNADIKATEVKITEINTKLDELRNPPNETKTETEKADGQAA